jgi:hypothetical protein
MKFFLLALGILIANFTNAQPELYSWLMTSGYAEEDGTIYSDSGDVQSVCYNNNFVFVSATGLAGTYSMGPYIMNPNSAGAKSYVFKISRNPTEELGTKTAVPLFGSIGVAVNGVVFYGYGDAKSYNSGPGINTPNGDGNWWGDAWVSEGPTMDASGNGHPDGMSNYHYHAIPSGLTSTTGTAHSPLIGFAYDGYPVYGPFGYDDAMDNTSAISRIVSGYELRNITDRSTLPSGATSSPAGPAIGGSFPLGTYIEDYEHTGNGDLDQYNGRLCVTPEYPGGTYAYFTTMDAVGEPAFPYLFAAEYYGEVNNTSTSNSIPGNVVCGAVTVSIDNVIANNGFMLYPNPAEDLVSFTFDGENPNKIEVINVVGKTVITSNTFTNIDVSNLISGVYFAKIIFETKTETIRFLKR